MLSKTEQHGECIVHHYRDGDFGISYDGGGWMPGSYDSVESALAGFQCCMIDEARFVAEIQEPVNHFDKQDRAITMDDINRFYLD